jgi:ubiquitin-like modifier-activating enzyme ATG7
VKERLASTADADDGSSSKKKKSLTRILSRFLLLTFADLKTHKYAHWFCFPALLFDSLRINPTGEAPSVALDEQWSADQVRQLITQYASFERAHPIQPGGSSSSTAAAENYFIVLRDASTNTVRVVDFDSGLGSASDGRGVEVILGFIDPCPLSTNMGWLARNMLTYAFLTGRVKGDSVQVLAFRDVDLARSSSSTAAPLHTRSRLFSVSLHSDLPVADLLASTPKAFGWERNKLGKAAPRTMDLGSMMDPLKLAEASVDLNLKLMRWRALPALDLPLLARTRCLLLGAGTLGCAVSRCLLGWGVRSITLLDSGTVSYSNPVRQSLFEFADAQHALTIHNLSIESISQIIVIKLLTRRDVHECHHMR